VTGRLWGAGGNWRKAGAVVAAILLASCSQPGGEAPAPAAPQATPASTTEASGDHDDWEGVDVEGLPAGSELWDITADDSGVFVAIGSLSGADIDYVLVIWRSEDGRSWQEVFRRDDPLNEDDAFVGIRSRVVAHDGGFAVVSADCRDACRPVAFYSPDGSEWTEVHVPTSAQTRGGAARSSPFGGRLVRGTPDYTVRGAQMLDVVATGKRLVAVGWAEIAGGDEAAPAAWSSRDGGRTWRRAPLDTFRPVDNLDELNRVRLADDRLVAGGGNRCCYDQPVGGLWVADVDGEKWRHVVLPEGKTVSISDLAVAGAAVHVMGDVDLNRELVHWRLSGDDRWDRLPAPPADGRLVAGPNGFVLVAAEATDPLHRSRLNLFTSTDGRSFQKARTSAAQPMLSLEVALVVGGRLHAYATAGEGSDRRRLLFTSETE